MGWGHELTVAHSRNVQADRAESAFTGRPALSSPVGTSRKSQPIIGEVVNTLTDSRGLVDLALSLMWCFLPDRQHVYLVMVNAPEPEQLADTPVKIHVPDTVLSGLTVPCRFNVSVPPPAADPFTVSDIAVVPNAV